VISIYKWQQVKALKAEGRWEKRKSLDDRIIKILKINQKRLAVEPKSAKALRLSQGVLKT